MRLLLLAGTFEARQIAAALSSQREARVIASLPHSERVPQPLGVPTRIGGFGGRDGFRAYLTSERIGAVLDATHPFADVESHRAASLCADLGLPYAQVMRPSWKPGPGDRWYFCNDEADAVRHVAPNAIVFVATGRDGLEKYANLSDRTIYARQIDRAPDPFPYPKGGWVVGQPPFDTAGEEALFHRLGVEWLVMRNAGGSASRAKLDAARHLELPVVMIRRPLQPESIKLETIAAALTWVRKLV